MVSRGRRCQPKCCVARALGRGARGARHLHRPVCAKGLADFYNSITRVKKGNENEAEFAPLDAESTGGLGGTSEEVFGPLAALLLGFSAEDYSQFQTLMRSMEAEMVPIYCASEAMMSRTLREALESATPGFTEPPAGGRRAVILSGMYTSEIMEVVGAYREDSLPQAVFAAAVPRNYDKNITALLDEVFDDDATMSAKQAT